MIVAVRLASHYQDAFKQTGQAVYVLHTYPFKETSLVVELFSQQFGRIAAVAKGEFQFVSADRQIFKAPYSSNIVLLILK